MPTPMEMLHEKKKRSENLLKSRKAGKKFRVAVGMATCEIAAGSKEVMSAFEKASGSGVPFQLSSKGCAGRCSVEPTVEVYEEGKAPVLYIKMTPEKAERIVKEHINGQGPINEYTEA